VKNNSKKRYEALLEASLKDLQESAHANADARDIVTLDQQSVGRLSRMDALQHQAMANATQARRVAEEARIKAALARLADDEFGYCELCGEDIPERRLKLTPTATCCVSCS